MSFHKVPSFSSPPYRRHSGSRPDLSSCVAPHNLRPRFLGRSRRASVTTALSPPLSARRSALRQAAPSIRAPHPPPSPLLTDLCSTRTEGRPELGTPHPPSQGRSRGQTPALRGPAWAGRWPKTSGFRALQKNWAVSKALGNSKSPLRPLGETTKVLLRKPVRAEGMRRGFRRTCAKGTRGDWEGCAAEKDYITHGSPRARGTEQ